MPISVYQAPGVVRKTAALDTRSWVKAKLSGNIGLETPLDLVDYHDASPAESTRKQPQLKPLTASERGAGRPQYSVQTSSSSSRSAEPQLPDMPVAADNPSAAVRAVAVAEAVENAERIDTTGSDAENGSRPAIPGGDARDASSASSGRGQTGASISSDVHSAPTADAVGRQNVDTNDQVSHIACRIRINLTLLSSPGCFPCPTFC